MTAPALGRCHASFTIAITMPIRTKTMIAACNQTHVGDMRSQQHYGIQPARPAGSLS
jgi:hypothetical protein